MCGSSRHRESHTENAQAFFSRWRRDFRKRPRPPTRSAGPRVTAGAPLTIDYFRLKQEYGGNGNRIDLAYAVYALSHGVSQADVRSAIASRDLSKKGNEGRQRDYVERTIRKAASALGR